MVGATALRATAALAIASAAALAPRPAIADEPVRINGSGSALHLMRPLLRAYGATRPEARFEMGPPLGSSGAMMALLAGALDVAVLARPVEPGEAARGARAFPYGRTPVVIVTHGDVEARNVSTAELEEIWSGRRATWPDRKPIRVVLRPAKETKTRILTGLSPGMARADAAARQHPWAIVAVTDPESDELVARTPGAIGAASLTSLLEQPLRLNALSLDGVAGTPQALADGRYPLASELVFAVTERLGPAARALVDFAFSDEGRAIAARAGVLVTAADGPR